MKGHDHAGKVLNRELAFVMRLAREFRRPDWRRRMLAEMSATGLGEWAEHFGKNSFSDMLCWMRSLLR